MEKEAEFDIVNNLYKAANKICCIEPTHIKKYNGNIQLTRAGKYVARIRNPTPEKSQIGKSFNTYEEAFNYVKKTNREYHLPIKNKIRNYGIYLKVKLTRGEDMIFDHRNLGLVQKHNIFAKYSPGTKTCYAAVSPRKCDQDDGVAKFHNLLMGHKPGKLTIDHINRKTNDNRMHNLRRVDRTVQGINRTLPENSETGMVGVIHRVEEGIYERFIGFYTDDNRRQQQRGFSIKKWGREQALQKAIDFRNKGVAKTASYIEALGLDTHGINMDDDDVYDEADDLKYCFESI